VRVSSNVKCRRIEKFETPFIPSKVEKLSADTNPRCRISCIQLSPEARLRST
jgi:hypothetical protein